MQAYGVFEWIFWILAFATGIMAFVRSEVFSTQGSQRSRHHSGQQFLLFVLAIGFALSGFVTAALAMRAGH